MLLYVFHFQTTIGLQLFRGEHALERAQPDFQLLPGIGIFGYARPSESGLNPTA